MKKILGFVGYTILGAVIFLALLLSISNNNRELAGNIIMGFMFVETAIVIGQVIKKLTKYW